MQSSSCSAFTEPAVLFVPESDKCWLTLLQNKPQGNRGGRNLRLPERDQATHPLSHDSDFSDSTVGRTVGRVVFMAVTQKILPPNMDSVTNPTIINTFGRDTYCFFFESHLQILYEEMLFLPYPSPHDIYEVQATYISFPYQLTTS